MEPAATKSWFFEERISYRANRDPELVDGYPTKPGNQFWSPSPYDSALSRVVLDRADVAWDVNSAGEERWALAPTAEDVSRGNSEGWTLKTRVRLPTTGDAPGAGVSVTYSDGAKTWPMMFGTAANGDPIVQVGQPGDTFTLQGGSGAFHTYELRYDPASQTADLHVDGEERLSNLGGQGDTRSPKVSFGDFALSTPVTASTSTSSGPPVRLGMCAGSRAYSLRRKRRPRPRRRLCRPGRQSAVE
jgi:hypothetical protein